MNYEKIRLRSSQFESVTSLKVEEFDKLLVDFESCLTNHLRYTTRGTVRLNRIEYSDSLPSPEHVLFFTLSYLKLNPLQEHHGASFDLSQESVSRWFKIGEKSLNLSLKKGGYTPYRTGNSFPEWLKKRKKIVEQRMKKT